MNNKGKDGKIMRKISKLIVPAIVLANIGAIYCSYKFEPKTEPGQRRTKKDILRRLFLRNIPEAILAELILGYVSVWQERKITCE